MNLLKAICKTTFSLLKWLLITTLIIGGIVGGTKLMQSKTALDIILIILLIFLLGLIVSIIVMSIKENYERITRKSKSPINAYKIKYNIVYERSAVVSGKTKNEALDNLCDSIHEGEQDVDSYYKTIKISEIK